MIKILRWLTSSATPWYIIGGCALLLSGMYLGYEIAAGRFAADREALLQAQADALKATNDQLLAEQRRGQEIATQFLTALQNIRIENKTFNHEVRVEREKLVYTDCQLPDSGVDLLNRHIDAANLRFLGAKK
jgi:hypothetical protein